MIVVGIHPYDIAALLHMDEIFKETKSDPYYSERRNSSIIIGLNIQNMSKWCFAAFMGCATIDHGYDLMLTDLGNSYAIEIGTSRGEELLTKFAKNIRDAYAREVQLVGRKKYEIMTMSKQEISFDTELIPQLLQNNYSNNAFWESHSEKCLACGSCVIVCPTCYCFDVRDAPDLTLLSGERFRTWDGCLLEDFAKVASGENFRPTQPTRYRHRYFKKGKYLFDRFGFISCVGCGRCSSNCLPDIANPAKLFNDMYFETDKANLNLTPVSVSEIDIKSGENINFIPKMATIVNKTPLTKNETLFEIKLNDGAELNHKPGQFVEVSVFGIGESPISIASSPTKKGTFELCVRKIGNVTTKIHSLNIGDFIGIRGPFGNGFDIDAVKDKDVLFIAGGLGIAPLRSFINYVLDRRSEFGKVTILYGCKGPSDILFSDEIASCSESDIVNKLTVDRCSESDCYQGNVGLITTLIPQVTFDPEKTYAFICGPPVMYKFVIEELKKRDFYDDHIVISLERRMKCGVGKCGHCQINEIYVCKEGPVFNYAKIKGVPEAL